MKKNLIYLLGILVFVFSSCEKKSSDPEVFSEKTVEENKQIIENSGIEMMNTMSEMQDLDAIEVCINLAEILETSDPVSKKSANTMKFHSLVNAVAALGNDASLNSIFNIMKEEGELSDPESLEDVWESLKGTYSWNEGTQSWDSSPNSEEILLLFPAFDYSTSNDGALRIYDYEGVYISNPLNEEYTGDLPAGLSMDISVDDQVIVTYTFSVSYTNEGIPSALASDLSIPPFSWEVDMTNSETEVSLNYSFKNENQTVVAMGVTTKGDITQQNIEDNMVTVTEYYTYTDYEYNSQTGEYEPVEVTEEEEYEDFMFEEVFHSASAYFQLFDIQLKGQVDIKSLADEIREMAELDDKDWTDQDYEENFQTLADVINEYAELRLLNIDEDEKIADIEAYVAEESDEDGSYYWLDFRFVFGDGSTVDAETYFSEGFEDFIAEINQFILDMNSEYDLEFETIDY